MAAALVALALLGIVCPAWAQWAIPGYSTPSNIVQHSGPASEVYAGPTPRSMAVTGDGAAFVVGKIEHSPALTQIALWCYEPNGSLRTGFPAVWPDASQVGHFEGITLSVAKTPTFFKIYVAGVGKGVGKGLDTFVLRFDPMTGAFEGVGQYDGPGNFDDTPVRIFADPGLSDCDVYVVGTTIGLTSTGVPSKDYYLARFEMGDDECPTPCTLALLESRSFNAETYPGGSGLATHDTAADAAYLIYTPDCALGQFDPPPPKMIFITGTTNRPGTSDDYFTIGIGLWPNCCSPSTGHMTELWRKFYVGPLDGGLDQAVAIQMVCDDVVVTGASQAHPSTGSEAFDYLTVRYSACGSQTWVNRWNGDGNGPDIPRRLAGPPRIHHSAIQCMLDPEDDNFVYVTGGSWRGSALRYDIGTIAINWNTGVTVWHHYFHLDNQVAGDDFGQDIACMPGWIDPIDPNVSDRSGGVYVTGRAVDAQGHVNYVTYRLKRRESAGDGVTRLHWNNNPRYMVVNVGKNDVPTTMGLIPSGVAYPDLSSVFVTGRAPGPGEATTVYYYQEDNP